MKQKVMTRESRKKTTIPNMVHFTFIFITAAEGSEASLEKHDKSIVHLNIKHIIINLSMNLPKEGNEPQSLIIQVSSFIIT